MASIIKNEDQIRALKEITGGLETVSVINKIMATDSPFVGASIGSGRGDFLRVDVDEKDRKLFDTLCEKTKARLVKEITAKAEKYKILLDEEDLRLMGGPAPSETPGTGKKKKATKDA